MNSLTKNLLLTCVIAATYGLVGCAQSPAPEVVTAKQDDHAHGEHGHSHDKQGHSGDGWWCDEHGVPETECGLCDAKAAAAFKKKGDWCKEHDRPDSQCFSGWQMKHCELGRSCSLHQSPFFLNTAASFSSQSPHSASGTPCSSHHQPSPL